MPNLQNLFKLRFKGKVFNIHIPDHAVVEGVVQMP